MARKWHNLEGVTRDIESVLKEEGDNEGANTLARFTDSLVGVLDGTLREKMAGLAEHMDELSNRVAELEDRMDSRMDDDSPSFEDEDDGDLDGPTPRVDDATRGYALGSPGRRPRTRVDELLDEVRKELEADDAEVTIAKPPERRLLKR